MNLRLTHPAAGPEAAGRREKRAILTGYGHGDRALALALEEKGFKVWIVPELATARQEAIRREPDVVLVGPANELEASTAFLRAARADGAARCILYMARRNDPAETSEAIAAGAHDIVVRPHSATAVLVRVALQEMRARASTHPLHSLAWGRLALDLDSHEVRVDGKPLALTGREFELLLMLLEAGGRVVTREALIGGIWGSLQDNAGVLEANVHRLRRKLSSMAPDEDLLETVRGVGYRMARGGSAEDRSSAAG